MAEQTKKEVISKSLRERIVDVSHEMKITKTGENKFQGYKYMTPEDIMNGLKPLLKKHGVYPHFTVDKLADGKNKAILRVSTTDTDEKPLVYTMTAEDIVLKGANSVQSAGGFRTYAKRYLLMDSFLLADNSDDYDSMENGGVDTKKQQQKASTPSKSVVSAEAKKLQQDVIKLCKAKGGKDNKALMEILKKYNPIGNPMGITSESELKKLKAEVEKFEQ